MGACTADTSTESCYRAVQSRDRRFDGVFYTAVHTTGIYCRPSCPARTPADANVTFYPTAASAAHRRLPGLQAVPARRHPRQPRVGRRRRRRGPGDAADRRRRSSTARVSTGWPAGSASPRDTSAGCSPQELGASPLALARARRAQTARILIETTDLTFADVAFAAGFASVRQFNDTMREVYAASPTELRGRRRAPGRRPGRSPCGWPSGRRSPAGGCWTSSPSTSSPGVEVAGTRVVRPHPRPAPRRRHGPPRARRRARARAASLRGAARVPARGPSRHRRGRRASTPTARRRLRPAGRRRPARRRPGDRRARPGDARPAGPRPGRR